MDARELTKKVTEQDNKIFILEKKVEYLTQELEKQRLIMDDMSIDVKMLTTKQVHIPAPKYIGSDGKEVKMYE